MSTRKNAQYKTQEHHGNAKAEGLQGYSNKSTQNHASIQRHKNQVR